MDFHVIPLVAVRADHVPPPSPAKKLGKFRFAAHEYLAHQEIAPRCGDRGR
jgi:hypothetical protein